MSKSIVLEFKVAGTRFYPAHKEINLASGDRLTLVAEPTNPHDDKAIKVLKDTVQIGHVPKVNTEVIHPVLSNPDLESIVSYVDLGGKYPTVLVTTIV